MASVKVKPVNINHYTQLVEAGKHHLTCDAPTKVTKEPMGLDPHELVYGALGACTAITLQMYARRTELNLVNVEVEVKPVIDEAKPNDVIFLQRAIILTGNLSDEDVSTLAKIADKCPIHKLLEKSLPIETNVTRNKVSVTS